MGNRRRNGLGRAVDSAAARGRDRCRRRSRETRCRVRMLSTGHGRKNDDADALAWASPRGAHHVDYRHGRGHRHRPTRDRRTPRRPGEHPYPDRQPPPCRCSPSSSRPGAQRELTADKRRRASARHPSRDAAWHDPASLAVDLVTELRHLDRRITKPPPTSRPPSPRRAPPSPNCPVSAPLTPPSSSAGSVPSADSAQLPRSPPTPVPPRLTYLPATLSATGSPAPVTASSTTPSCHGPHTNPARHPGRTYYLRKRTDGKATRKRCDALNGAYPTSSTDNSEATQTDGRQAREDTRGRL